MMHQHIKRFLSVALLVAFTAPSALAMTASTSAYETLPYTKSMTLAGDVQLSEQNDNITLSLRDSDVKQVLRMFADKVGMNIVFHSSVSGQVTLDLVNMPINDAFNLVLQVTNLNYYKQGNTLIIIAKDNAENATFSKQEMMVFPVKYVSADKIANFLNKNVFGMKKAGISSVDAATINAATNEIIIFGMKSDAAIVQKVIEQFDREPISRTFKVNHTTPAEMADMICNFLLPSRGVGGGSSSGGGGGGDSFSGATGGASGILTGAASSSGGGGGSSELKLGEGVVACSVVPTSESSINAPFEVQNLAISYYPQRGTIMMLGGSEEQAQMVQRFIENNDTKQPQAYLELSIIELNEDGSKEFANTWSFNSETINFNFDLDGGLYGGREGTPGTRGHVPLKQLVLNDDGTYSEKDTFRTYERWYGAGPYISWQMKYLITNKKARVLANPKLLITNGQESTIDLTTDYVEKITSEFMSSSTSGTVGAVQRTYSIGSDMGIKVTLTPFISPDGYVTLNINPDYATSAGDITAMGETGQPEKVGTLLSRRNLELKNIRIKDGETLVIGGLIQETETKTVGKIPVLGDLPIIGAIFRSSSTQKIKSELVIMITPKIINDDEQSVADTL